MAALIYNQVLKKDWQPKREPNLANRRSRAHVAAGCVGRKRLRACKRTGSPTLSLAVSDNARRSRSGAARGAMRLRRTAGAGAMPVVFLPRSRPAPRALQWLRLRKIVLCRRLNPDTGSFARICRSVSSRREIGYWSASIIPVNRLIRACGFLIGQVELHAGRTTKVVLPISLARFRISR